MDEGRSRRIPIETIDLLDAGVADKQWRFVWREAGPVTEGSSRRLKSFHTEDALQFAVSDSHAEIAFLVIEDTVKVQITCILRPDRISHEDFGELGPFLRGNIKEHQL